MKKYAGGGGEGTGRALKSRHYIFVGEWAGTFFFQSSGRLVFVKMYNFMQVVVLLKMQFCGYPLFKWDLGMKIKSSYF